MSVEWTDRALDDMAALDPGIAGRVKRAVERFAATGAGSMKRLRAVDPTKFRLRAGDRRVRFGIIDETV